jgi:hypothetical protein
MPLSLPAIERLFLRLIATYGQDFLRECEGMDSNAVKAIWAHELAAYESDLKPIAWALENLPDRAPSLMRFKALCRAAPRPATVLLPSPAADPGRVAEELAKLGAILQKTASSQPVDHKAWARKIMTRIEYGQKVCTFAQRCARQALGLPQPESARRLQIDTNGRVQQVEPAHHEAPEPEFA